MAVSSRRRDKRPYSDYAGGGGVQSYARAPGQLVDGKAAAKRLSATWVLRIFGEAVESLMGTIKSERVHAKTYRDREQAAPGIFEYMECLHDRLRPHSALGYMSPCEFEETYADRPLAA